MRKTKGTRRRGETYARARAALVEEYEATFGCTSDLTPWGEHWPDVLARANEVDRLYVEADGLLGEVVGSFDGSIAFLRGRGLDPFAPSEPLELSELAGHTLPEAALLLEVCGDDGAFRESHWLLRQLTDEHAQRLSRGKKKLVTLADEDVPVFVRYVDGRSVIGTDRSLRLAECRVPRTGESVRLLVPGLTGPPPRSLEAGGEWCRTYLAELLGASTRVVESPGAAGREAPAFTDRAIAVAALLCGGIDSYSQKELERPASVVNAERKAIALARRRRTFPELVRRETEASARGAGSPRDRRAPKAALPVPASPGPARIKSTHDYRTARAALEREYRTTFNQDWDTPPWGRSRWSDILPKALELDRHYLACMDHIEEAVRSLDRARAFLLTRGLNVDASADIAFDSMLAVGKTPAENILYRAFIMNDGVVKRAHARLRELHGRLREVWNVGICDVGQGLERRCGPGFTEISNTVIPQRGLVHLEITRSGGDVVWRGWAPGIYAPPPRSLRADANEWRRWYVATLLETYDRTTRRGSSGPSVVAEVDIESRPVIKDRDVAIISLLAGGLELLSVAALRKLPQVIDSERKAVALARKRARIALATHWREPTTG